MGGVRPSGMPQLRGAVRTARTRVDVGGAEPFAVRHGEVVAGIDQFDGGARPPELVENDVGVFGFRTVGTARHAGAEQVDPLLKVAGCVQEIPVDEIAVPRERRAGLGQVRHRAGEDLAVGVLRPDEAAACRSRLWLRSRWRAGFPGCRSGTCRPPWRTASDCFCTPPRGSVPAPGSARAAALRPGSR